MGCSYSRLLLVGVLLLQIPAVLAGLTPEAMAFVDEVVAEHALFKEEVVRLLEQAQHKQDIIDKITGRAEKKGWYQYRPIFLNDSRIGKGVEFWRSNSALLHEAEETYGVPPAIIVAILGVETYYGERAGNTRVLDALYTLAFGYPQRAPFFREELKQFLLLTNESAFDPATVAGSYAGAMGASQFISSSYRNYAVDGDGDGHIDLWKNKGDIIASVANYFAVHGWRTGEPVAIETLQVDKNKHGRFFFSDRDRLLKEVFEPEDLPNHAIADLTGAGIRLKSPAGSASMAYLMPFEAAQGTFEYWAGMHNFYVITRYNRSPLYAMAVYQLSREIEARLQAREEGSVATH
ncbi:MAG: lytic murein transglycosylase B [Gammaproteobacteria bacterium]|nr:lytic murein transglycosylase B [Gammaproteobacteria bacterium]MBU1653286.1 lytic murein transglycosylase B [Gammaproteobacteria bacterium]MBU1961512.1 lytic murein transglycosylase B [Gammaproteobacteria bacterium]